MVPPSVTQEAGVEVSVNEAALTTPVSCGTPAADAPFKYSAKILIRSDAQYQAVRLD
jgi:hypothetical protein